jgi:hypothetical protein
MSSPNIKLYDYVPNPIYDDTLYILKEKQISSTLFRYEGQVGYGFHEYDFESIPDTMCVDSKTGEVTYEKNIEGIVDDKGYPVKYYPNDMRDLNFTYDTEKNEVVVDTHWRYEVCEEEAKEILNNVKTDYVDDETCDYCYPYLRFPRSKDGISVSRLFNYIFPNKNIKIFLPKSFMG